MRGCCWISLHLFITSDQHFYHHLTFVFEKKWMHIASCTVPAATTFPAPVHKPPPQRRATNKLAASHPTTSAGTSLHTTRSAPGRRRTTRVCTWSACWSDERSNSNPQKHIYIKWKNMCFKKHVCVYVNCICIHVPESSPSGRGEIWWNHVFVHVLVGHLSMGLNMTNLRVCGDFFSEGVQGRLGLASNCQVSTSGSGSPASLAARVSCWRRCISFQGFSSWTYQRLSTCRMQGARMISVGNVFLSFFILEIRCAIQVRKHFEEQNRILRYA